MSMNILNWGWLGLEEHTRSQVDVIGNKKEEVITCQITKGQRLRGDAQSHTEHKYSLFRSGGRLVTVLELGSEWRASEEGGRRKDRSRLVSKTIRVVSPGPQA